MHPSVDTATGIAVVRPGEESSALSTNDGTKPPPALEPSVDVGELVGAHEPRGEGVVADGCMV